MIRVGLALTFVGIEVALSVCSLVRLFRGWLSEIVTAWIWVKEVLRRNGSLWRLPESGRSSRRVQDMIRHRLCNSNKTTNLPIKNTEAGKVFPNNQLP